MQTGKRVGEILCDLGYATEKQVQDAVQLQAGCGSHQLLGQILIEQGIITPQQSQSLDYCQKCILLDVIRRMNSTMDLQSLLKVIMEAAQVIVAAEASSLILLDKDTEELIITVPTGRVSDEIGGIRVPAGQGLCGWILDHDKPLVIPDVQHDARFFGDVSLTFQTRNLIGVPLHTPQGESIGVLEALNKVDAQDFTAADVSLFCCLADQAAVAIERAWLQQEILQKKLLEQQLEFAHEIQSRFWPSEIPVYEGIQLAGMSVPATSVGGDYYDFIPLREDRCVLVIGDVSGKGVGAALLMATLRAALRAQVENNHPAIETVSLVNKTLVKDTPDDRFATLFYAELDKSQRQLRFVNAGHNAPILYNPHTGCTEYLTEGGVFVGFLEDWVYEGATKTLQPGHVLVLYTDGVTEAQRADGEMFGMERLEAIVREHAKRSASELLECIYAGVEGFVGTEPQFDDITLVVLKVEDEAA